MSTNGIWRRDWESRPAEEAALFNPAFCGELLLRAAVDYFRIRGVAMPLPFAFLGFPLTLHSGTRRALPGKANTSIENWSIGNAALLAVIPDRVLQLRPVTREALLFMLQVGALAISAEGLSQGARPLRLSGKPPGTTADVEETRRSASLLGRWFANQLISGRVLQAMGVTL